MITQKPRFNTDKIRRTFYDWHGGQSSPLYAAASSGLVADVDALRLELTTCANALSLDPANYRKRDASGAIYLRTHAYQELVYLKRVAASLPDLLGPEFVHPSDGRTYRAFAWATVKGGAA